MPLRTPLAWLNLTHDFKKMTLAVGGIGFAVLLMFTQVGFKHALFDSVVEVVKNVNGDIVIINRSKYALTANRSFSYRRIAQARGCEGVSAVFPLYIEPYFARWRPIPKDGEDGTKFKQFPIRVLAYRLGDPVWNIDAVNQQEELLRQPGSSLFDMSSKSQYRIRKILGTNSVEQAELSGKKIKVVGTFSMGTDFANDGNIILSANNFAKYFPNRARGADPLTAVDIGVVQVKKGQDIEAVAAEIRQSLPDDVSVMSRRQFIRNESNFWRESTPIGLIFNVGLAMGLVVGVIICYQIIYSDITDHMPEFATLMAMGYPRRYFIIIVLKQSVYLCILGFMPGVLVSAGVYWLLGGYTGLPMLLTWDRTLSVFGFALVMCVVSGCFAMRKLLQADPAELF
jgi:putative ABC transport system permease protein